MTWLQRLIALSTHEDLPVIALRQLVSEVIGNNRSAKVALAHGFRLHLILHAPVVVRSLKLPLPVSLQYLFDRSSQLIAKKSEALLLLEGIEGAWVLPILSGRNSAIHDAT